MFANRAQSSRQTSRQIFNSLIINPPRRLGFPPCRAEHRPAPATGRSQTFLRLLTNICSSWLIRDNTLSFGRDKYWIPLKKREDDVCAPRVYLVDDIVYMCVLCIIFARARLQFHCSSAIELYFYTSTNLKFPIAENWRPGKNPSPLVRMQRAVTKHIRRTLITFNYTKRPTTIVTLVIKIKPVRDI